MIAGTKYPLGVVYLRQVVLNSLALPVVVLFSNAFNNTSTQDSFKKNKLISPLDFAKILFDNIRGSGKDSMGQPVDPPVSIKLASLFLLLAFAPLAVVSAIVAIAFSIVAMPFYLATMILTAPLSLKIHSNYRKLVAEMADEVCESDSRASKYTATTEAHEVLQDEGARRQRYEWLDGQKARLIRLNKIHDMLCTITVNALIVGTTAVAAHFFGTMILSKGLSLLASAGIVQSDTNILANLPGGGGLAAHICFTFPVLAISLCAIVAGLLNVRSHYKMLEQHSTSSEDIVKEAEKIKKEGIMTDSPIILGEKDPAARDQRYITEALNNLDPGTAALGVVEYPGGMDSASLFRHSSNIFRGAELLVTLPMSVPVSLCNAVLSCCNNQINNAQAA